MNWQHAIVIDPAVLLGKPVIRGTRISVELIVDMLARGWTHEEILGQHDHITEQDILACLSYESRNRTSARR